MNTNRIRNFLNYCVRSVNDLGQVTTAKWVFSTLQLNLNLPRPRSIHVRPKFLDHPVRLRARTSDAFVFRQIMIEDEYRALRDFSLSRIIDLGANVGMASAYFLSRFPDAHIFAVEADIDNFHACRMNLAPYDERARVFHGAAWSKRTTLTLHRRTCAADNTVNEAPAAEPEEITVEGWDIASLIALSGFDQVDLLKIDIEGAEKHIFEEGAEQWLPFVKNICIELHGESCRRAFFSALADYEYDQVRSGELELCLNLRPRAVSGKETAAARA